MTDRCFDGSGLGRANAEDLGETILKLEAVEPTVAEVSCCFKPYSIRSSLASPIFLLWRWLGMEQPSLKQEHVLASCCLITASSGLSHQKFAV